MAAVNDLINCPYHLPKNKFDLEKEFSSLTEANIIKNFPFKHYLDSARWWSYKTIDLTFSNLNSIQSVNHSTTKTVLITCLVDSLLARGWSDDLDSLELLLTYSEKYLSYAEANDHLADFFEQVADSWCVYVAAQLSQMAIKDNSIKDTYKFNYVAQHSNCLMYPVPIPQNTSDKIVRDLTGGRYIHILKRYWFGTSSLFKGKTLSPLILLASLFIYGCICIYQKHFKQKSL